MPPNKYVAPHPTAANAPKKKWKAEKERPEGMTNAEWDFDLQRRSVENASRRQREVKAKEREAAAKQATMMERAAAMAGMAASPPLPLQYVPPHGA
jgi:hypothetical protein